MNDELQALRRVAQVLARVTTPIERQNIARRVAQKTKGDDSELALSLSHAAALFWPGDPGKTAQVLENITQAFDAGELGGFIPKEHRHILFTELTVWPDCPAMAVDSPLRYWVPDAPAQPQGEAEIPIQSAPAAPDGQAWTLRQPQRFRGYRAPLYRFLKAAQAAGQPCPKARDVLEAWRDARPDEVFKVLPGELHYYDAEGNAATAPIAAVQKAIDRLTEREKPR